MLSVLQCTVMLSVPSMSSNVVSPSLQCTVMLSYAVSPCANILSILRCAAMSDLHCATLVLQCTALLSIPKMCSIVVSPNSTDSAGSRNSLIMVCTVIPDVSVR